MIVGIIGLGLIGGSMAIDLKRRGFARIVLGVEADPVNAASAANSGCAGVQVRPSSPDTTRHNCCWIPT